LKNNCNTFSPFKLNCWKHHAGFIANQINKIKSKEELRSIPSLLLEIGESQMDLYLGKLTPSEINEFTKNFLKENEAFNYEPYEQWLFSEGKEYRLITLSDKSIWALRMGIEKENYIHIHPGRYSLHTIRARALTLKTAICVMAYLNIHENFFPDLELINDVRKEFLNAAPVKSLSATPGLRRLLNVFNNL